MLVEKYINDRLVTTTVRKTTLPGGERVNKERSPTTVRTVVGLRSSIFNLAKQERLVTQPPATSPASLCARSRGEFVFQHERTGLSINDIKTGFTGACRAAGILNLTSHDLRHTWSTRAAEGGVPESVRRVAGGDSNSRPWGYEPQKLPRRK